MVILPQKSIPIIGVPGYPVSAVMTSELFIEPLIARWLGRKPYTHLKIQAKLTRKVTSPPGDDDYLRMAVGHVGDQVLAAPLARGAGIITSMARADGLMLIPQGVQGRQAGDIVDIALYRSPSDIDETIFAIGSHDMILDIMAQYLAQKGRRLVSANVGSQAGLVALRRGEAHLAGSHLLDPETGDYNLKYIKQYLPDVPVTLITLVGRQQGLITQKGNPKQLLHLKDLFRSDVMFINRQRGAGTRVLLDYQLGLMGRGGEEIKGYNQEEYTHLAVAAAVASGRADCGLGIAAAARALNLDFVPLFYERYDLVIPDQFFYSELLKPVFDILHNPQFKEDVQTLPGYDTSIMGKVVAGQGAL
jgi:putative molybdopterin biosynthesis protein